MLALMNEVSDAARKLSALGASKGGRARADRLTPEERSRIASGAAQARWAKEGGGGAAAPSSVRLSVNISPATAEAFRALMARRELTATEGVRRAIAVWKFIEDEVAAGNEVAVIEADGSLRKVTLL
jgi:hypothetical protein